MTVFCNGCGCCPAVMLTLLRLLWRTMLRSFGGIKQEALAPGTAACHSSGVAHARDGIRSRGTKVSSSIGASLGRCSCALDRAIAHGVPRTSKGGYVFSSSRTNRHCSTMVGSCPWDPPPGRRLRGPAWLPASYAWCWAARYLSLKTGSRESNGAWDTPVKAVI
jgi:hypothetical protein